MTDDDLPALHIGDHVTDRDDEDEPPLVVVGLPLQRAATYEVDDGTTIADVNPDYSEEDHVVEVAYAQKSDAFLNEQPSYGFPRSRLELVTPLHNRDEGKDD